MIATSIFPPDIGGPATHSAALKDEFEARGHQVRVLTLSTEVERDLRGVVEIPCSNRWVQRHAAVLRWLLRNRDTYDVVYATGLQSSAVLGARLAHKPVVVKVVGDAAWERSRRLGLTHLDFEDFQRLRSPAPRVFLMRLAQRFWVRSANAVVVPSAYLLRTVTKWTKKATGVVVIPNAVAPTPIQLTSQSASAANGPFRCVCVARLVGHKQVDVLLRAVAQLPDAHLDVIGDGPEARQLAELSNRLGLTGRVTFHGQLPHRDVLLKLSQADALLSASQYEGLSHVMLEALVVGTPIISTDVGGLEEILAPGENGFIVGSRPEDFAGAISQLSTDQSLHDAMRAHAARAGERWTVDRCAQDIEDLLRAVVKEPDVM